MEDRCVSCGAIIPEGRQVCHGCLEFSPMKAQIEERNELVDLLEDIGHDWDAYLDECQKNEEEPQLSYEDFHADAILEAGYRKQSEGEWVKYPHNSGIYCSLCKHKRRYRDIKDAYCPNCGAKMKGARNE